MGIIFFPYEWFFDHTFGYIFKALFFLLSKILPKAFITVLTRYGSMFVSGIKMTLGVSLFGTLFGLIIAIILASIRNIKIKKRDPLIKKIVVRFFDTLIKVYVTIFRGTPMMVQAMIIYYGLVGLLHFSPGEAGLIVVSINTGAYLTEVIKKGIDSVDYGQIEASLSLGMSPFLTLTHIVFPQAIKNQMASIGNEFVINIKDTSVLNVIGCAEMYFVLKTSASYDYTFMETMLVGALIYLLLTLSVTKILSFIDKKLGAPKVEILSSN